MILLKNQRNQIKLHKVIIIINIIQLLELNVLVMWFFPMTTNLLFILNSQHDNVQVLYFTIDILYGLVVSPNIHYLNLMS